MTQAHFDPIFRGETINGIPGVTTLVDSWLIQFRSRLYFGYPSSGSTYRSNVLVVNLTNNRTSYYTWGREIRTVTVDHYNDRLLAGDTSGYIWELEDTGLATDNGTAISWEVESKNFVLQTRANFPRSVKYDVDAASATTAAGAVYLEGVLHQTHTLTEDRNTRKRLVATGNGKRMSVRISGTGPVEIYAVEAE